MLLVVKKGYASINRPDTQVSVEKIPAKLQKKSEQFLTQKAMEIALTGYYPNWYTKPDQIRLYEPKTGNWAFSVYIDTAEKVRIISSMSTEHTYHVVTENGTFLILDETMTVCSNFIEAYNGKSSGISEIDELV